MRLWTVAVLLTSVVGCVYITRADIEDRWDADGDGWPVWEDCDDNNPLIHPYAPDVRGDGCNANCGTTPDADGDDWPDDEDCDPHDPTIFPCSPFEVPGDGIDHDCDGTDGIRTDDCDPWDPDFALDEQQAIPPEECGYPSIPRHVDAG